jgi:prefoldin subunit 5
MTTGSNTKRVDTSVIQVLAGPLDKINRAIEGLSGRIADLDERARREHRETQERVHGVELRTIALEDARQRGVKALIDQNMRTIQWHRESKETMAEQSSHVQTIEDRVEELRKEISELRHEVGGKKIAKLDALSSRAAIGGLGASVGVLAQLIVEVYKAFHGG